MAQLYTILPPYLYRYRKIENEKQLDREIAAIKEGVLRFTDYKRMNDPMEGIFSPSSRFKNHTGYTNIVKRIRDTKRNFGLCCFSETKDNELMWAHYASNYKGICVGYRSDRLLRGLDDNVRLVRVTYGNEPPIITDDDGADLDQAARKILSHKKSSWVYEREWRLIGSLDQHQITSKGCAHHVYLGSLILEEYQHKILRALGELHLTIFQMKVDQYSHVWTKIKGLKERLFFPPLDVPASVVQ